MAKITIVVREQGLDVSVLSFSCSVRFLRASFWKRRHWLVSKRLPCGICTHLISPHLQEIRKIALEVSDPSSPSYGEYLTQSQIDEITRPTSADTQTVQTWLKKNGIPFQLRGVRFLKLLPCPKCPCVYAEPRHPCVRVLFTTRTRAWIPILTSPFLLNNTSARTKGLKH